MSEEHDLFPVDGVRVDVSKSEQVHKYDMHILNGNNNMWSIGSSDSNNLHSYSTSSGSSRFDSYSTSSASCYTGPLSSSAAPTASATNSIASVKSTTTNDCRAAARNLISKTVQQYLSRPTVNCPPIELHINLHFTAVDDFAVDINLQPQRRSVEDFSRQNELTVNSDMFPFEQTLSDRQSHLELNLSGIEMFSGQLADNNQDELISENKTSSEGSTQLCTSTSSLNKLIATPTIGSISPLQPLCTSVELIPNEVALSTDANAAYEKRDTVIEATCKGREDQWSQGTGQTPTGPIGSVDLAPLTTSTAIKCVQTGRSMLARSERQL